jgi:hypothetical protein
MTSVDSCGPSWLLWLETAVTTSTHAPLIEGGMRGLMPCGREQSCREDSTGAAGMRIEEEKLPSSCSK